MAEKFSRKPVMSQVKADVEKRVSEVLQRTRELESYVEQLRAERRQVGLLAPGISAPSKSFLALYSALTSAALVHE